MKRKRFTEEQFIGALLGHKDTATTQRYTHLSTDPLRAASQAVADTIFLAFEGVSSGR